MSADDVTTLAKAITDLTEILDLHRAALQSLQMRVEALEAERRPLDAYGRHSVKA